MTTTTTRRAFHLRRLRDHPATSVEERDAAIAALERLGEPTVAEQEQHAPIDVLAEWRAWVKATRNAGRGRGIGTPVAVAPIKLSRGRRGGWWGYEFAMRVPDEPGWEFGWNHTSEDRFGVALQAVWDEIYATLQRIAPDQAWTFRIRKHGDDSGFACQVYGGGNRSEG